MSLINIIKKSQHIRKLFGKCELKIIEKQLLGVSLKLSERTRLSRDIRKKFQAIDELSNFSLEFNLKKGSEIKYIIEETKEIILENKHFKEIEKIILFGSAAENQMTLMSDIDIAVVFSKISKKDSGKFRIEISSKTNDRVDIQVYNFLSNKIKKEIDKKGRIIYEQKN